MATDQHSTAPKAEASRADEPLQPFHGLVCPGICFASGHCFWVFNWESTPTAVGDYDIVWIITPDGERLLYVDPPEAGPIVETYHEFDRTVGATITWDRADNEAIDLHLDGEDGTMLDLRAELGSSAGTSLLNAITSLTPQSVLRTSIGETISNLSITGVMDVNGLKVAGITDTQEPYRVEADRMRAVQTASATLNDENLGEFSPPDRPIEFGDAKTPDDSFVSFGDLYLRPPSE